MKKLEKLILLNKTEISIEEQKNIRGGDYGETAIFSGDGSYLSVSQWYQANQNSSGMHGVIGTLASAATGSFGTVSDVFGSFFDSANRKITQTLLDKGYTGSSSIYVDVDYYGNGGFYNIRVYDGRTGVLISNI